MTLKEKVVTFLLATSALFGGVVGVMDQEFGVVQNKRTSSEKKNEYDLYRGCLVPMQNESIRDYEERLVKASEYYTQLSKRFVSLKSASEWAKRSVKDAWTRMHYEEFANQYLIDQKLEITDETLKNNPFLQMLHLVERQEKNKMFFMFGKDKTR